jgi:hypothetical protein
MSLRKKYNDAIYSNTAIKNLMSNKLNLEDEVQLHSERKFLSVYVKSTGYTTKDAEWITKGGKGTFLTINDITAPEDMFVSEEVELLTTFKIGGLEIKPLSSAVRKSVITTTSVGLYNISGSMLEWAKKKVNNLIKIREKFGTISPDQLLEVYIKDLEWVADDSLLIAKVFRKLGSNPSSSTSVFLLSQDHKLAKKMARSTGVIVYRVDPYLVISRYPKKDYSSAMEFTVDEIEMIVGTPYKYIKPRMVLCDTGSFLAVNAKHIEDTQLKRVTLLGTGMGPRWEEIRIDNRQHFPIIRSVVTCKPDYNLQRPIWF